MKPTRNLWPFGIIAAFAIFIPATAGLIVLAVTHKETLVRPDYYEQEVRYQQQIDRLGRARQFGTRASLTYDTNRHQIAISLPAEHAQPDTKGRIELFRPSEAGLDRHIDLTLDSDGRQALDAASLRPGLWKVRVIWTTGGQEYALEEKVVIGR